MSDGHYLMRHTSHCLSFHSSIFCTIFVFLKIISDRAINAMAIRNVFLYTLILVTIIPFGMVSYIATTTNIMLNIVVVAIIV